MNHNLVSSSNGTLVFRYEPMLRKDSMGTEGGLDTSMSHEPARFAGKAAGLKRALGGKVRQSISLDGTSPTPLF